MNCHNHLKVKDGKSTIKIIVIKLGKQSHKKDSALAGKRSQLKVPSWLWIYAVVNLTDIKLDTNICLTQNIQKKVCNY